MSCQSPLLAEDGMLVEWVDDARARSEAWAVQARAVAEGTFVWERQWIDRAGLFSMVPTFVLAFLLIVVGGALRGLL